jgi:hypothetical protein
MVVKETVANNPERACKMAVNWATKTIRRMTCRKALERWETKVGKCEITPQALLPIVKSLMKRDGTKAPTAVHGCLGITYHPNEKTKAIADCLDNQFTSHDLCDKNHKQCVQTRLQALHTSVDDIPSEKVRLCDIQKLVKTLMLRKHVD